MDRRTDADADGDGPPPLLRRAALAVQVEGGALALLGVAYVVLGVLGDAQDRAGAALGGVLALLVGLGLVRVGGALGRGRGGALAPTVVVQVMTGVIAIGLLQGGLLAVGVPLLLVAGFVLYALSAPPSREVFRDAR